eukprot:4339929-Pyramimonas_sp.AAC.1
MRDGGLAALARVWSFLEPSGCGISPRPESMASSCMPPRLFLQLKVTGLLDKLSPREVINLIRSDSNGWCREGIEWAWSSATTDLDDVPMTDAAGPED